MVSSWALLGVKDSTTRRSVPFILTADGTPLFATSQTAAWSLANTTDDFPRDRGSSKMCSSASRGVGEPSHGSCWPTRARFESPTGWLKKTRTKPPITVHDTNGRLSPPSTSISMSSAAKQQAQQAVCKGTRWKPQQQQRQENHPHLLLPTWMRMLYTF